MTLRADSYSSVAEVTAFTRHLLHGQSAFNSTTRPTSTEIEKFIDRASGAVNMAAAARGYMPASVRANSTAKLMFDDWVTAQAAMYVEMTQRGTGFGGEEGSRVTYFSGLSGRAEKFLEDNKVGIQRLGVTQSHPLSEGLQFTGMDAQVNRTDPADDTLEQPMFRRRQFDFPKGTESQPFVASDNEGVFDE